MLSAVRPTVFCWSAEGRRVLGEIEGVEEEGYVRLLSAAADDPRPVLAVQVLDGLVEGVVAGTSVGFVDPRVVADLLIEHGFAAPIEEGR